MNIVSAEMNSASNGVHSRSSVKATALSKTKLKVINWLKFHPNLENYKCHSWNKMNTLVQWGSFRCTRANLKLIKSTSKWLSPDHQRSTTTWNQWKGYSASNKVTSTALGKWIPTSNGVHSRAAKDSPERDWNSEMQFSTCEKDVFIQRLNLELLKWKWM